MKKTYITPDVQVIVVAADGILCHVRQIQLRMPGRDESDAALQVLHLIGKIQHGVSAFYDGLADYLRNLASDIAGKGR